MQRRRGERRGIKDTLCSPRRLCALAAQSRTFLAALSYSLTMKSNTLLKIANAVALIITIVMNGLSNSLPFNNVTTAEVSNSFPSLITPSGYVFSIWGLIYIALIAFVIYSFASHRANATVAAIGGLFVLSCIANSLWLVFFQYGYYVLSLLDMLVLLASLIMMYGKVREATTPSERPAWWFTVLPFSLYLGWITVATAVNASVVLLSLGWVGAGLSPVVWATVLIGITCVLSLFMSSRYRDVAYTGVIVWALVGIAVRQSAYPALGVACGLAILVSLVGLGLAYGRRGAAFQVQPKF